MPIEFDLQGVDGLEEELAEKAKQLEKLMGSEKTRTAFKAAMQPITQDAKARVHSITGGLRSGIETHVTSSADAPTEIEVGISYKRHASARHAHLVEDGHGGPHPAPPHPFWEPAVQAHYQEALQALDDTIDGLIDELFS